jgi:hypothetical protein
MTIDAVDFIEPVFAMAPSQHEHLFAVKEFVERVFASVPI